MKKNIFSAAVMVAFVAASLVSCDKSKQETPVAPTAQAGEMKVAFVEFDSIMSQYQFCKDADQILTKRGQEIEKTLTQKQNEIQNAANNFQQKLQQNALTQQQAQQIQSGLQKQAQGLEDLRQRLGAEYAEEQANYQKAIHDSIQHFINRYNADKKYSMILSKSGDNLLYADKSLDITKEVVAGLNKSYKPAANKPAAETKKEEKK